jgi:Protein of unknown function (DUF2478)
MSLSWVDPRRLAAVVYDDGVAVDRLLETFASELGARGVSLGGVLAWSPAAARTRLSKYAIWPPVT